MYNRRCQNDAGAAERLNLRHLADVWHPQLQARQILGLRDLMLRVEHAVDTASAGPPENLDHALDSSSDARYVPSSPFRARMACASSAKKALLRMVIWGMILGQPLPNIANAKSTTAGGDASAYDHFCTAVLIIHFDRDLSAGFLVDLFANWRSGHRLRLCFFRPSACGT
jgi:hypothetical protein